MVKRVVNDIDEIVRHVRFNGWQNTHAGEREVKKARITSASTSPRVNPPDTSFVRCFRHQLLINQAARSSFPIAPAGNRPGTAQVITPIPTNSIPINKDG